MEQVSEGAPVPTQNGSFFTPSVDTLVLQLLGILKGQLAISCQRLDAENHRQGRRGTQRQHTHLLEKCSRLEHRLLEWKKGLDELLIEIARRTQLIVKIAKLPDPTGLLMPSVDCAAENEINGRNPVKQTSPQPEPELVVPDGPDEVGRDELEIKLEVEDADMDSDFELYSHFLHGSAIESEPEADSEPQADQKSYPEVKYFGNKRKPEGRTLPEMVQKTPRRPHPSKGKRQQNYRSLEPIANRTCPECSRVFRCVYEMRKHIQSLHNPNRGDMWKSDEVKKLQRLVRCDVDNCCNIFPDKKAGRKHQLEVHGNILVELLTLTGPLGPPNIYKDESDLPPPQYACTEPGCEKLFRTHQNRLKHVQFFHRGDDPWECPKCGLTLKKRTQKHHHKTVHSRVAGRVFTCEICGKCVKSKVILKEHQRTHTAPGDPDAQHQRLPCPYCDMTFAHKSGLTQHTRIHTGRPFICDECGWSFSSNQHLKRHKLSHERGTAMTEAELSARRDKHKPKTSHRPTNPKPLLEIVEMLPSAPLTKNAGHETETSPALLPPSSSPSS